MTMPEGFCGSLADDGSGCSRTPGHSGVHNYELTEVDPRTDPATMERAARASARVFAESAAERDRFAF